VKRFLALSFLLSSAAAGQTLVVGPTFSGGGTIAEFNQGPVQTDIDLSVPAPADGTVTSVHFGWQQAGCANVVKIKFFHRVGNNITMTDERGPLPSVQTDNLITLTPPVSVRQGDLIGITKLSQCGGPMRLLTGAPGQVNLIRYAADVTGTVDINAAASTSFNTLAVSGSGPATRILAAVLPVVGSTAGGFGSHFVTSLQLANGHSDAPVVGRAVFHPAGAPAGDNDPAISFSIDPQKSFSYPDLVAAFGRTGLGSVDIYVQSGSAPAPTMVTRVFNDAGAAGTNGFAEDAINAVPTSSPGERVLTANTTALLITPVDPARTRYNIGVRTFFAGVAFTATLRNADGSVAASVTKSYLPMYFEQVDATSFFGGVPVSGNQTITINVTLGSAVIYGATTDNVTNDPSVQFAGTI
jgi:hypothetical protein